MSWKRLGRTRKCPAGIARYKIKNDRLYLWCSGTETREEWRWNFDVRTEKTAFGRVNRRDYAQAFAVIDALNQALPGWSEYPVYTAGYSRGGAIAVIVALMVKDRWVRSAPDASFGTGVRFDPGVRLFAPKRAGIRLPRFAALHSRGDLVPFLPFWYTGYDLLKFGRITWPWKAHLDALKTAAKWRASI